MRTPEILLGCCQAGTSRIVHTQDDLPGPKRAHLALNRREASAPNVTQAGCFSGRFGPDRHRRGTGFLALGVERTFCQTGLSAGGPVSATFPLAISIFCLNCNFSSHFAPSSARPPFSSSLSSVISTPPDAAPAPPTCIPGIAAISSTPCLPVPCQGGSWSSSTPACSGCCCIRCCCHSSCCCCCCCCCCCYPAPCSDCCCCCCCRSLYCCCCCLCRGPCSDCCRCCCHSFCSCMLLL